MRLRKKGRFDLIELCLIGFLFGVAGWTFSRSTLLKSLILASSEGESLAAAYGPDRFSEHGEEWIIRDFFKDRREGYFVDIGANHYKTFSNTYYLEERLGWSGIAVDPQQEFEADYRRYRPRTRFFPLFVSDTSHDIAEMFVLDRSSLVASARKDFTEQFGANAREVSVPTITLNDLLSHLQVARIDLLSIDVELSEPSVLAGFDIEKYRPALVCIEAHPEVRQDILDYFTTYRYVVVGRYLRADTQNLYFVPLD